MSAAVFAEEAPVVQSANVVGYLNRDGREKYNFITPCFDKVGGTSETIDIQEIQLTASVPNAGAYLQVLNSVRGIIGDMCMWMSSDYVEMWAQYADTPGFEAYQVYKTWPKGNGAWVDSMQLPANVGTLQFGQTVQIALPEGVQMPDGFKFSGQVSDADGQVVGRPGYNFVGNPYAVPLSIQNIQCDASVPNAEAFLQILDSSRGIIGDMCLWMTAEYVQMWAQYADTPGFEAYQVYKTWPEGQGAWVDSNQLPAPVDPLQPADGVQISLPAAFPTTGGHISILAPIEL